MLVNMTEILKEAEKKGYAIGCINTPNVTTLRAVVDAAEELNTPIIIDHAQVHDAIVKVEEIGPRMVEYAKQAKVPVCVHVDHGTDEEFILRALKVGFTSIMFDQSALPFEENVKRLKRFTDLAHKCNVSVEAELGIMTSSDNSHGAPDGGGWTHETIKKTFTDPAQAADFAKRTGVDALAVCFGTAHGTYAEPPILDIDRVKAIRASMPEGTRVCMHGASGVDEKQVQAAITAGVSKINYYTYMAKAASKHMVEFINSKNADITYETVDEENYKFMKEWAKKVITTFKNGK